MVLGRQREAHLCRPRGARCVQPLTGGPLALVAPFCAFDAPLPRSSGAPAWLGSACGCAVQRQRSTFPHPSPAPKARQAHDPLTMDFTINLDALLQMKRVFEVRAGGAGAGRGSGGAPAGQSLPRPPSQHPQPPTRSPTTPHPRNRRRTRTAVASLTPASFTTSWVGTLGRGCQRRRLPSCSCASTRVSGGCGGGGGGAVRWVGWGGSGLQAAAFLRPARAPHHRPARAHSAAPARVRARPQTAAEASPGRSLSITFSWRARGWRWTPASAGAWCRRCTSSRGGGGWGGSGLGHGRAWVPGQQARVLWGAGGALLASAPPLPAQPPRSRAPPPRTCGARSGATAPTASLRRA